MIYDYLFRITYILLTFGKNKRQSIIVVDKMIKAATRL